MNDTQTETPIQRLERLRAETAERTNAASAALPVRPGDTFHCLTSGATIPTGQGFLSASHISKAGQNVIVTQAMIDASYSSSGASWMALIDDPEGQRARWREERFRLGPAPADAPTWGAVGDADWREAREQARREAWAQPTLQARAEALAAVNARFGPAAPTSTIISTSPDPSIKLAAEQRAALDAGGVRHVSHYTAVEPGARR
ncbi:hypothetical protein [Microbacterium sp. NPDC087589]|uniref:hypothetical protein n=1 Tax=Microbacterium sp. NPDC087589 TaxID=3364191 RepID=UPI0038145EA4